jgi:hypothetical protein
MEDFEALRYSCIIGKEVDMKKLLSFFMAAMLLASASAYAENYRTASPSPSPGSETAAEM